MSESPMFIDDELFMAGSSSPSKEQKPATPVETFQSSPFALSTTPKTKLNKAKQEEFKRNTQTFAGHMLQSLIVQISRTLKKAKKGTLLGGFMKWKIRANSAYAAEKLKKNEIKGKIKNKIVLLINQYRNSRIFIKRKAFFDWALKSKAKSQLLKLETNKIRQEEAHQAKLAQMNRMVSQLISKQCELEKQINSQLAREKKYKEAITELKAAVPEQKIEKSKNELVLRELERENQNLRDKLEVIENNVDGFIKEMSGLIEAGDEMAMISDDDGMGDSPQKLIKKRAITLNIGNLK
ncbi:unnamed protein product [Blepharisma stoltei]|uniref:Uncharacterized protein n=1 Tax=Blepharisma stoltei TaxID=1481888 RepID=A0AAU9JX76_9CILI|nr:unnamed protein product [Blepharisma stoltei]